MRTVLGAALAVAMTATMTATMTCTAMAGDLAPPNYYTAPAALASSWAGPYIGATLGYEWARSATIRPGRPASPAVLRAASTGSTAQFRLRGEADIQLSGAEDTFAPWQFSNPWFGTVRGRAGVAIGNVLLFGTAGLAYGSLTATTPGNLSETHTSLGWVAGAGAEVAFTPHWSAKAEWLYLDFSDRSYSVTGNNNGLAANLLRLGVNYHF